MTLWNRFVEEHNSSCSPKNKNHNHISKVGVSCHCRTKNYLWEMFAEQLDQTEQHKHLVVHIAHHMRKQGNTLSPHKQACNQQQIYLKTFKISLSYGMHGHKLRCQTKCCLYGYLTSWNPQCVFWSRPPSPTHISAALCADKSLRFVGHMLPSQNSHKFVVVTALMRSVSSTDQISATITNKKNTSHTIH